MSQHAALFSVLLIGAAGCYPAIRVRNDASSGDVLASDRVDLDALARDATNDVAEVGPGDAAFDGAGDARLDALAEVSFDVAREANIEASVEAGTIDVREEGVEASVDASAVDVHDASVDASVVDVREASVEAGTVDVYVDASGDDGAMPSDPCERRRLTGLAQFGAPVAQIATGYQFACAIVGTDQQVVCWGSQGMRGIGIAPGFRAIEWSGRVLTGVVQLALGSFHGCARTQVGALHCWGNNDAGQIVNVTESTVSLSRLVATRVSLVAAGSAHTCIVYASDPQSVRCVGSNASGQLGVAPMRLPDGGVVDAVRQSNTVTFDEPICDVSVGEDFSCAMLASGAVECWGGTYPESSGQRAPAMMPRNRVALERPARALRVGQQFACAILEDDVDSGFIGEVYCWGVNFQGGLGNAAAVSGRDRTETPTRVALPRAAGDLLVVDETACARLEETNEVYCWGRNDVGQLGHGTSVPVSSAVPLAVRAPGSTSPLVALRLAQSSSRSSILCAIRGEGMRPVCWGDNESDGAEHLSLGNRATTTNTAHGPVEVDLVPLAP